MLGAETEVEAVAAPLLHANVTPGVTDVAVRFTLVIAQVSN